MAYQIYGNISGLAAAQLKQCERLYQRSTEPEELIGLDLARELLLLAQQLRRRIGILVNRRGQVEKVIVGTHDLLFLPALPLIAALRLRGLRLIFSDLSRSTEVEIPNDIVVDLEKLRLDAVVAVKLVKSQISIKFATLQFDDNNLLKASISSIENLPYEDLSLLSALSEVESQLSKQQATRKNDPRLRAFLIGVYPQRSLLATESMIELRELARTAGVVIAGEFQQFRPADPRYLLGKGKLEQVILEALRLDADLLIFDCELRPGQWRIITNATEMRVIDRSMLILDIFAQRAQSSDGRAQVELAQLKYNLPRLVELDAGLSRLTGGIGGRGPGETKLELGRRRIRERITALENNIQDLQKKRDIRSQRRLANKVPMVALIGYTNAGKSSLFNRLTKSQALAEDKLFATLDTLQRQIRMPSGAELVVTDTVGFIRFLPKELFNAFRATLEEINKADLLVHVIDGNDPALEHKKEAVEKIIEELNLNNLPIINVISKIDLVPEENLNGILESYEATGVSALSGGGVAELKQRIVDRLQELELLVPAKFSNQQYLDTNQQVDLEESDPDN